MEVLILLMFLLSMTCGKKNKVFPNVKQHGHSLHIISGEGRLLALRLDPSIQVQIKISSGYLEMTSSSPHLAFFLINGDYDSREGVCRLDRYTDVYYSFDQQLELFMIPLTSQINHVLVAVPIKTDPLPIAEWIRKVDIPLGGSFKAEELQEWKAGGDDDYSIITFSIPIHTARFLTNNRNINVFNYH